LLGYGSRFARANQGVSTDGEENGFHK
jgi:hypothetical protein